MNSLIKLATIEDDDSWQYLIKREVEKENLFGIVLTTKCGNEFFEKYPGVDPIDFVLLDINLPQTPGIDVAKRIKRLYPKLPIIVFTSSKNRVDRDNFHSIGVDYYLSKHRYRELHHELKVIMGLENSKIKHRLLPVPNEYLTFIEMVCQGKTNIEIANNLKITPKNVEYKQKMICDYYQLDNSKLALVDFARSYDIL
ncbi:MAG: response regulator [Bacteroidia bacterium]